jgi:hypothetical protein
VRNALSCVSDWTKSVSVQPKEHRSVAPGFPFEFLEGSREGLNDSLPEERTDFVHYERTVLGNEISELVTSVLVVESKAVKHRLKRFAHPIRHAPDVNFWFASLPRACPAVKSVFCESRKYGVHLFQIEIC